MSEFRKEAVRLVEFARKNIFFEATDEIERALLAAAQAGEARRAETALAGSVHEHAVAEGDVP